MEKVMQLVKELSTKVETTSIQFSKRADVRQAEGALRQSTEERLSEPRLLGDRDQESHRTGNKPAQDFPHCHRDCDKLTRSSDDDLLVVESSINLDSLRDVLFSELHEADGQVRRNLRANEELPEMRAFRSERRNFNKSEMALAWAESHRSEILWVDGYQALTRADFNASFVFPLLQLVESRFDTVVSLRHFCENHHDGSDKYLVMMQSLVWQFLRQNPSIAQRKRASLDRERTSTTRGLWVILSELLEESKAKCVFLVIGGIDSLVNDSSNPRGLMTDMINQFHGLICGHRKDSSSACQNHPDARPTTAADHNYRPAVLAGCSQTSRNTKAKALPRRHGEPPTCHLSAAHRDPREALPGCELHAASDAIYPRQHLVHSGTRLSPRLCDIGVERHGADALGLIQSFEDPGLVY